jgi:hypothetical protein
MSTKIRVSSGIDKALSNLSNIEKKAVPAATASALNKTIKNCQVEAARIIKGSSGIKVSTVKEALPISKANKVKQWAEITARKRPTNLIEYVSSANKRVGAFRNKPGVRAKTNKTYTVTGSFIAPAKGSGKLLVLQRRGDSRLPTKTIYGPSVYNSFKNDKTQTAIKSTAEKQWQANFERELEHYIRRQRGE